MECKECKKCFDVPNYHHPLTEFWLDPCFVYGLLW
jgi:hypothetical protein